MDTDFSRALEELAALRQYSGARPGISGRNSHRRPARLISADMPCLLGSPGKTPHWGKIGDWDSGSGFVSRADSCSHSCWNPSPKRCLAGGGFVEQVDVPTGSFNVAVRLKLLRPEDEVLFAAQLKDSTDAAAREAFARLKLIADVPLAFQQNLAAQKARQDVEKFAAVLDLNVPVNEATHFLPAVLAFSNGIATRFRCDRAGLGWIEAGYVKLRAISRTEAVQMTRWPPAQFAPTKSWKNAWTRMKRSLARARRRNDRRARP